MTRTTLGRATWISLTLGVTAALVGCMPEATDTAEQASGNAEATENGLMMMNGLSVTNGLAVSNGLSLTNGLAIVNGLSETTGLMTSPEGRQTVSYLVRCALPAGRSIVKRDQNGTAYTYMGAIGLAPEWETGSCSLTCQHWISACMLAHVNTSGAHVPLWLVGQHPALGWGRSADYPNQEGTFFGNVFQFENGINTSGQRVIEAYYCNGPGFTTDVVPGRLGDNGQNSEPYINAYGQAGYLCSSSKACTPADSPYSADGYKQCFNLKPTGLRQWTTVFNEAITVWRASSALGTGGTGGTTTSTGGTGGTTTSTGGTGGTTTSTTSATPSVKFDFEGSLDGWTFSSQSSSVGSSNSQKVTGNSSMMVGFGSSGTTQVDISGRTDGPGQGAKVTFNIFMPSSGMSGIQPFVQDKNGGWSGTYIQASSLKKNAWNQVTITVPSGAALPLKYIGMRLQYTSWQNVFIDSVTW